MSDIESIHERRLRFDEDKLCGRTEELKQLHGLFDLVRSGELSDVPIALVNGSAGTGKSRLVRSFQKDLEKKYDSSNLLFIQGRADGSLVSDPFSSLIHALNDLCTKLFDMDEADLFTVKEDIIKAVADEAWVLCDLIPGLASVVGNQESSPKTELQRQNATTSLLTYNRHRYLFQKFIKSLCRKDRPLVLYVDDFQWVDKASLDLIGLILSDTRLEGFLCIATCRDNEVGENHIVRTAINQLESHGRRCTRIHVGNLSCDDVQSFIQAALRPVNEGNVPELARIVFNKTRGNIFFVKSLLPMLEQRQILLFSDDAWQWDTDTVERELESLENSVSDVFLPLLEGMPKPLQRILSVASFLPLAFHLDTLTVLLELVGENFGDKQQVLKLLDTAVIQRVLNNVMGTPIYRFDHCKVQESAKLFLGEERDIMATQVALSLIEIYDSDKSEDWMLFAAANHVNSVDASMIGSPDGITLEQAISLNRRAASKAVSVAAFAPASQYLGKAIALLEQDEYRWQTQYELCCNIYSIAADIELTIGSFDVGQRFANEVLENGHSFEHKMPAMFALSEGYGQRERHADALALDCMMLKTLGEMPKGPYLIKLLSGIGPLKKAIATMGEDHFLELPVMEDEKKLKVMAVLANVIVRAGYCGKTFFAVCCALKMIRLTLQHGLCGEVSFALNTFASALCAIFGDVVEGKRINQLALRVARAMNAKSFECKVLFFSASYIDSWQVPLPKTLDTFNRAFVSGCESGDLSFGILSLSTYNVFCFACGFPLGKVMDDINMMTVMSGQYSVETVWGMLQHFRQLVVNLIEGPDDMFAWTKEPDLKLTRGSDHSLVFRLIWAYTNRTQTSYYFGDFSAAHRAMVQLDRYVKADRNFVTVIGHLVFSSLISTAMFRKNGRRNHRRRAKRSIAMLKKIVEKGRGLNSLHKLLMLEADFAATFSDRNATAEVKAKFEKAISSSTRAGYIQDAALCGELCAEYFIRQDDLYWAKHYFALSHKYFSMWGATAKVRLLLDRRGDFIDASQDATSFVAMSSMKGRRSLTGRTSEMHQAVDTTRIQTGSSVHDRIEFAPESIELTDRSGNSFSTGNVAVSPPTHKKAIRPVGVKTSSSSSIPNSLLNSLPIVPSDYESFSKSCSSIGSGSEHLRGSLQENGPRSIVIKAEPHGAGTSSELVLATACK